MKKTVLPESFDFGVPSVEIIGAYSGGLHKEAMLKRASAFDDIIADLKPRKDREYLHVITTGAHEVYGPNQNGDSFNGASFTHTFPFPEKGAKKTATFKGGLSEYHDTTYMKDGAVYQEHQTKSAGVDPSGEVIAARYNEPMSRGELIIGVDKNKWARRLQKKANGENIYLSIGCSVPYDTCTICGHQAKTASQHCDHIKKHRLQLYDCGIRASMMNDQPMFYDISGVDVPADKIAFVLRKVASGEQSIKEASLEALINHGTRRAIPMNKAALLLDKLSRLEKELLCKVDDDFDTQDDDKEKKDFILEVQNYPADEVIDGCNRHGLLLTPDMLFDLMGKEDPSGTLSEYAHKCHLDCKDLMTRMKEDEDFDDELLDGAFDQHFPADLNLESIIDSAMPDFGMTAPAVNARTIIVVLRGKLNKQKEPKEDNDKKAFVVKQAEDVLSRVYARYLISFAAQNNDDTCRSALRKLANY
jgi:hypothetical protein